MAKKKKKIEIEEESWQEPPYYGYVLRADKSKKVMTIERYEYPNFKEVKRGSVYQWNDIYFLCADYMMLKKFASELKRKWIKEAEEELDRVKNIKIKGHLKGGIY